METIIVCRGYMKRLYRNKGKENGNYYSISGLYRAYIGIMETKMETTIVSRGYI